MNNDTGNIEVKWMKIIYDDYPIVFVIIVVEGSPGDEDKHHGEDHEDDEDGAGVNIDGENCQASKVARYSKSIKSESKSNSKSDNLQSSESSIRFKNRIHNQT